MRKRSGVSIAILFPLLLLATGVPAAERVILDDNDELIGPPIEWAPSPLAGWVDAAALDYPDPEVRALARAVQSSTATKPELRQWLEVYQLHFPFDRPVPRDWRERAAAELRRRSRTSRSILGGWENMGPTNVGGRVAAIAFDPSNPDRALIGAAGGGVWEWRWDDAAQRATWTPLFDSQPTLSIGAVGIDPTNPGRVYVGTGELNFSSDCYHGMGLIRSDDGGQTWLAPVSVDAATRFSEILVRPDAPNVVLAATNKGLYRSTDRGDSWEQVLSGGSVTDLVMDPSNPDNVYAGLRGSGSSSGVYKSTAGADPGSFSQLGGGLPNLSANTRVSLTISVSSPGTLYAFLGEGSGQVWKTTNGGQTWVDRSGPSCGGQCWYDISIAVDPTNPDHVIAGGVGAYRTVDGGATWSSLGGMHVDHHRTRFAVRQGQPIALDGNDGGLYRISAFTPTTADVDNQESGFVTAQYYGMGHDPVDPARVYGGTQDNGSQRFMPPATNTSQISLVGCGDGAYIRVNPGMNNRVYVTACPAGSQLRFGVSDNFGSGSQSSTNGIDTSESSAWVPPIEVFDARTIYVATNRMVYKCTNADTPDRADMLWTELSGDDLTPGGGSITTIASTPADPRVVWAGTTRGEVWITADGGQSWTETWVANGGRRRYVGKITASRTDSRRAWLALGGIGGGFDSGGHVFETLDGGQSWQSMNGDLPDIPVSSIVPGAAGPEHFWAGTWLGVFETRDHGTTWLRHDDVPFTSAVEIVVDAPNDLVYAATHGRGMWRLGNLAAPPKPVPDGNYDPGTPLYMARNGTGVRVTWDVPSCAGSTDYSVFWGDLADAATFTYSGAACGVGVGGDVTVSPPPGDLFFLMAGTNGAGEESGHRRADGGAGWTPASGAGVCPAITRQDLSQSCP